MIIAIQLVLRAHILRAFDKQFADWKTTYADPTRRRAIDRMAARAQLSGALWGDTRLSLLQRLTIMFPLIGVVATGGSLIYIVQTSSLTAGTIDTAVIRPDVFYGVMFGALLALANHVVVLSVTHHVHRVLQAAEREYPDWIDREPAARVEELITQLKTSVMGYDKQLRTAAQSLTDSTTVVMQRIGDVSERLQGASKGFGLAASSLATQVEKLSTDVGSFNAGLQTIVQRSASNWSAIEKTVTTAASAMEKASRDLEGAPIHLRDTVEHLRSSCQQVNDEVHKLRGAASQASDAVKTFGDSAIATAHRLANAPAAVPSQQAPSIPAQLNARGRGDGLVLPGGPASATRPQARAPAPPSTPILSPISPRSVAPLPTGSPSPQAPSQQATPSTVSVQPTGRIAKMWHGLTKPFRKTP